METVHTSSKKPHRKGSMPKSDIDLSVVAAKVAAKWAENTWLNLQWIDHAEFQTAVDLYTSELSARMQTAAARPAISAALKQLDADLDKGVRYIKTYLFDKYDTDAKNHYHAFGLVKVGDAIRLPRDQNQKTEALAITLQGIASEGFNDRQYGKTFWLEKANAYNALLAQASEIDSSVASKVGAKNRYRSTVTCALNSIILALRSNFPNTYASEIRSWGFQKEKY